MVPRSRPATVSGLPSLQATNAGGGTHTRLSTQYPTTIPTHPHFTFIITMSRSIVLQFLLHLLLLLISFAFCPCYFTFTFFIIPFFIIIIIILITIFIVALSGSSHFIKTSYFLSPIVFLFLYPHYLHYLLQKIHHLLH